MIGDKHNWVHRPVTIVTATENGLRLLNIEKALVRMRSMGQQGPVFEAPTNTLWEQVREHLPEGSKDAKFIGVLIAQTNGMIDWVLPVQN
jgi:hypothetical protein